MNIFRTQFASAGGMVLASAFALLASAAAEEAAPPAPKPPARMVEIEGHFFRATDAQIRTALKAASSGEHAEPAGSGVCSVIPAEQYELVMQALRNAQVDFFSSPRLVTKSGQRALVEAVRELRYPTEFSPESKVKNTVTPTAFETRNVGVTVEIEPVAGPDDTIDLAVVTFLGFIDYSSQRPTAANAAANGLEQLSSGPLKGGGIWQPVFFSSKVSTNVTLFSGQSVLLGGMSESKPAGLPKSKPGAPTRLIYILLTARAAGN